MSTKITPNLHEIIVVSFTIFVLILAFFGSLLIFSSFNNTQQPEPIAVLIFDITDQNVANKSNYTIFTERPEDVYICIHISINQAKWIADNYGYKTGVVMLWSYINDSHARTWVEIGNETYIIESINDQYWTVNEHKQISSPEYEIEFITTTQGQIHAIESSEAFSNQTETFIYS